MQDLEKNFKAFSFLTTFLENLHKGSFQEDKGDVLNGFLSFCFWGYLQHFKGIKIKNGQFGPF